MIGTIDRWIWSRLAGTGFRSESDVRKFSLVLAVLIIALVIVMTALGYVVINQFGLLPIPLFQAVLARSLASLVIGLPLAFIVIYSLSRAIYKISQMRTEFERLSRTDMLSGLLNRRAFSQELDSIQEDASVVIIDVDRFKSVNDRFGHIAGDEVIQKVAATIAEIFGPRQVVARIGGEEFGVIISGLDRHERLALVDHARTHIEKMSIVIAGEEVRTTISAGVADTSAAVERQSLFAAADRALYAAKAAGRNRIVHADHLELTDAAA